MLHRLPIILQYLRGGFPPQRPHGEAVVVPAVVYLKLLCEILKGIEGMGSVEPLVVLSVAAFPSCRYALAYRGGLLYAGCHAVPNVPGKGWAYPSGW